jgi:hypothetical protein
MTPVRLEQAQERLDAIPGSKPDGGLQVLIKGHGKRPPPRRNRSMWGGQTSRPRGVRQFSPGWALQ